MFGKNLLEFLNECFHYLSVPGTPYLRNSKFNCCEKIIWLLILSCGIIATIWLSWRTLIGDENPFETNVDDLNAPISEIQFPTVTVCPSGRPVPDSMAFLLKLIDLTVDSNDKLHPINQLATEMKNATINITRLYMESDGLNTSFIEDYFDDPSWNGDNDNLAAIETAIGYFGLTYRRYQHINLRNQKGSWKCDNLVDVNEADSILNKYCI